MTECERIISEGILPETFFREEIRSGFFVTSERKKLWAIELDLLLKFDAVCKQYGLKYFLNSGSLLGAVRHKGFIPWDDDMDVEMTRDDYDKLMSLSNNFDYPYFLQTTETDGESAFSFTKLRNSNTTGASAKFAFQNMNQGVFIDIFPFDRWQVEDKTGYEVIQYLAKENGTFMRMKNPVLSEADKARVAEWSGIQPLVSVDLIHKIARKYHDTDTNTIISIVCTIAQYEKKIKLLQDYEDVVYLDFEGFKFSAPIGYDRILKKLYGDYMQFPPVEQRGKWHGDLLFNPDVPYTEYLEIYRNKVLRDDHQNVV